MCLPGEQTLVAAYLTQKSAPHNMRVLLRTTDLAMAMPSGDNRAVIELPSPWTVMMILSWRNNRMDTHHCRSNTTGQTPARYMFQEQHSRGPSNLFDTAGPFRSMKKPDSCVHAKK